MAVGNGASYRTSALPIVFIALLLGVLSLVLMVSWLLHFRGGISINTGYIERDFNTHPLLMFLGLIFLGGQAIMAHKMMSGRREHKKFIHSLLQFCALALSGLGLYSAFKFHRDLKVIDMYSLHSWFGITAVSLYALQWIIALFAFLIPGTTGMSRANYAPWHAFFGIAIFIMAIVSAETGIAEKLIYVGVSTGSEALLANFAGLTIFLYGIAVFLVVILPRARSFM